MNVFKRFPVLMTFGFAALILLTACGSLSASGGPINKVDNSSAEQNPDEIP